MNLTMAPGAGDDECLEAFKGSFLPEAEKFQPDFVLVSAGFDGHEADPLAQLNMTEQGYNVMTEQIKKLAQKYCQGRLLSVLEGGYQLDALSSCVAGHLNVMMRQTKSPA